jgi:Domain of unknown function (DUF4389)
MFVTIWMCTHEWSLISIRATAFTFETCHQPLSWSSALTRSISVRSLRLPRTGTLIRIRATASAGVRRASCSASSETGWSILSAVSLSIATLRVYASVIDTKVDAHPIRLLVEDDYRRNRLTVFFRLLLAIPHFIWFFLWSIAALIAAILNWFATLIMGRPPRPFHRFLGAYVRYQFHVYAFLSVAANPFPGFTGKPGSYPLDLALPEQPQRQSRWKTLFRIILVVPAWFVSIGLFVALAIASICTWFVALIRGEAPWGLRNLMAYGLRYFGQSNAYLYLLTDAYPHASPLEGDSTPAE